MAVKPETCIYCKSCLKIGCPALTSRNGKAYIEPTMCTGCTVCAQVCPTKPEKAIQFVDEKGLHISGITLDQFLSGGKE